MLPGGAGEDDEINKLSIKARVALDKGCLQYKVLMQMMQLIAHAIADSFGCDDASAGSEFKRDDMGVIAVLAGLARGDVKWNDWFSVACRPMLAVQYGGLAAIAPWIDVSRDLWQKKPFSMEIVTGTIGVPIVDGSGKPKMQAVQGDFAVIEAHSTEVFEIPTPDASTSSTVPQCAAPRDDMDTPFAFDVIMAPTPGPFATGYGFEPQKRPIRA
ncbi:hypothetical protein OQA88_11518 [Cercophora sp. LCS_1]